MRREPAIYCVEGHRVLRRLWPSVSTRSRPPMGRVNTADKFVNDSEDFQYSLCDAPRTGSNVDLSRGDSRTRCALFAMRLSWSLVFGLVQRGPDCRENSLLTAKKQLQTPSQFKIEVKNLGDTWFFTDYFSRSAFITPSCCRETADNLHGFWSLFIARDEESSNLCCFAQG